MVYGKRNADVCTKPHDAKKSENHVMLLESQMQCCEGFDVLGKESVDPRDPGVYFTFPEFFGGEGG